MSLPIYLKGQGFSGQLTVYATEVLTIAAGQVKTPTAALLMDGKQPCVKAWATIEGGDIRYRSDGTPASATVGHRGYQDGNIEVKGSTGVKNLSIAAQGATQVTVTISYSSYRA